MTNQSSPSSSSTTRICIKNLPPSFDEAKLKHHLQSSSLLLTLTDCRILKTKEGRNRKIAFVGFKNHEMAQQAVSYFDRSFALTSRLSVSLAFSKKEGAPPTAEYRPWSKHSEGSSRNQKMKQKQQQQNSSIDGKLDSNEVVDTNQPSEPKDKKLEEFLSVMGVSVLTMDKDGKEVGVSKSKFWANDDVVATNTESDTLVVANLDLEDSSVKGDNEIHYSDLVSSSTSDATSDENLGENEKCATESNRISSDLDFMRSKQVNAEVLTDDEDDDDQQLEEQSAFSTSTSDESVDNKSDQSVKGQTDTNDNNKDTPVADHEAKDFINSDVANNALNDRLFLRNLPFTTTEEELFEEFSRFGTVSLVHIPVDDRKRNKGYAFITYQSKHDAKVAIETMDGKDFQGRLIHILPARPSSDKATEANETHTNLTYKERHALARQKQAEISTEAWSTSILRGDAVIDNLSDRLGLSKGDVLNVKDGISSGNAAVRLALGETHIITENIAFFEKYGVDIRNMKADSKNPEKGNNNDVAKRSKTMILVKNLPYDTSVEELTKVFHGIGGDPPQKILLPPSRTVALVEYGHATDARRAFRSLAYRKFKHVPLYLEWAPMMMEVPKEELATEDKTNNSQNVISDNLTTVKNELIDEEDPATEGRNTQSIYVKNLNFSTNEEQLQTAFKKAGFHPRAVKIPKKSAPLKKQDTKEGAEPKHLSMGFGFVEFTSEEEAKAAMKALQGKLVDGHLLEIKLSNKSLTSSSPSMLAVKKSCLKTKIMVRNVPFEATRSELLQLFGSFGQLKRVRLPKKFDGTHRGFAFCEFLTCKEAQNAMVALSRTHLYGRHLVLEWADDEEDEEGKINVEKVREKMKRDAFRAGLGDGGSGVIKAKRNNNKFDDE